MIIPKLKSVNPPELQHVSRADLLIYFTNEWELNEMLFSSIKETEFFYERPDMLRNPLIFYHGHTAAFYINKLKLAGLINEGIDERLDHLFAVGVDPELPKYLDIHDNWPNFETVTNYRKQAFDSVHEFIASLDETITIEWDDPLWALPMALEHDRIHFETSSVLIRQLDADKLQTPENWEFAPSFGTPEENEWLNVEGGSVRLGKPDDSTIFGWDNEYGMLEAKVAPFEATKNLISNSDFLKFVHDNGYQNNEYWSEKAQDWKTRTNTTQPKFWVRTTDGFRYRNMFEIVDMPLDWPAEVNAFEAEAYCKWIGDECRLMTEIEFQLIAQKDNPEQDSLFSNNYNLHFQFGSPTPVGYMKAGKSKDGFNDLYGNVWELLSNDFYPLPGFRTHPYYKDFSAPYMDNEHSMMAGGSWATTGTGASKYYRLWFRRHFYQHAGFRLAKSI